MTESSSEAPDRMKRRVHVIWLVGLVSLVLGAVGGWWIGVAMVEAWPADPTEPWGDLGTVFGMILIGLVLVPLVCVFLALQAIKAPKPLISTFLFYVASAVLVGILASTGTILLPFNIGVPAGAVVATVLGTLGGAIVTDRLIN